MLIRFVLLCSILLMFFLNTAAFARNVAVKALATTENNFGITHKGEPRTHEDRAQAKVQKTAEERSQRAGENESSPDPSVSSASLPFWTQPFGLNNPPANSAPESRASEESNFVLGTIVTCMCLLAIAILRLPRRPFSAEALAKFRNERDLTLLFGIGLIALGLGELYVGFRSGRMEYARRFGPNVWVSYSDSKIFFGLLGVLYSFMVIGGFVALRTTFEPSIAVAPLFKHARVLRLVWLGIFCFLIFALIFLR